MMLDDHFPTVSIDFLKTLILGCEKVEGELTVGKTTVYILKGSSQISKRQIFIREASSGEVDYMCATGIAIKLGLLGSLSDWFVKNKNWKDGAYFV